MNPRERLKAAYENVAFNADLTWANHPLGYHKTNLELYLTEKHLKKRSKQESHRPRPRTVAEAVPRSRLATQYRMSKCPYDESREMSYACSDPGFVVPEDRGGGGARSWFIPEEEPQGLCLVSHYHYRYRGSQWEPWELPEVTELFRWFLRRPPDEEEDVEGDDDGGEGRRKWMSADCYESPLMGVADFEDKLLKARISDGFRIDRVKKLWNNVDCEHNVLETYKVKDVNMTVHATPRRSIHITKGILKTTDIGPTPEDSFVNIRETETLQVDNSSMAKDLSKLQKLSRTFKSYSQDLKRQVTRLRQNDGKDKIDEDDDCNTSYCQTPNNSGNFPTGNSSEVLYSDVLQGVQSVNKKSEATKTTLTSSTTNYTVLSRLPQLVQNQDRGFPQFLLRNLSQQSPNNYYYNNNNYYYCYIGAQSQLVRQQRPFFPTPSLQTAATQQPQFPSVPTRWLYPAPSGNVNYFNCFDGSSSRIFMSTTTNRSSVVINNDFCNGGKVEPPSTCCCANAPDSSKDEHPISASISEELEIQALEQYNSNNNNTNASSSNDNFYQELERQAAEQYNTND